MTNQDNALPMTITKKEIIKEVSDRTGMDLHTVRDMVQAMFDCMCEGLSNDQHIEIRNFGIFKVKKTPKRKARNPKNKTVITVPGKRHIHFKPGRLMKIRINQTTGESSS
ncbi:MAG TPA: HU family DNA-binding protein [bacterium]|nr:HU family DNA-binding protein [bacterium]